MSTEIKNTLFRFVTMRAPELLEDDQIKEYFVEHPDVDNNANHFLSAISPLPGATTRAQALNDAVSRFTAPFQTREDVKAFVSPALYDFAVWMTANRSTFTVAELTEHVKHIETTGPEDLITLWDNLFYQILTFKSGYVREAIISVLVADFFMKKQAKPKTTEGLQLLAQARILIPKQLFGYESTGQTGTSNTSSRARKNAGNKSLHRELDMLKLENSIAENNDITDKLKKAKTLYLKEKEKIYAKQYTLHLARVDAAYAAARKIVTAITNPVTGEVSTITTYEGLALPKFDYQNLDESDFINSADSKLPAELADNVLRIMSNNGFDNIDEVIALLQESVTNSTKSLFENAPLGKAMVISGGIALPMADSSKLSHEQTFAIQGENVGALHRITMLFDNHPDDVIFDESECKILMNGASGTIDAVLESHEIFNGKAKVVISISASAVDLKKGYDINGEFNTDGDANMIFSGRATLTKTLGDKGYTSTGNGDYTIEKLLEDDNDSAGGQVLDYVPSGFGIKRLGIADYRKVEQEVCCYVPGEVSHIENIMAREYKEKSTRQLRRIENTETKSTETEREKLTDTTTTDRFEMNQEISSVRAEQNSFSGGGSLSWGEHVNASIHSDFAHNTSQEVSNHQAVIQAQEITERALERVVQKVKEERVSKVIEEFEENNRHGFDNRKGDRHISGVFRWVDKIYRNTVINYGKRLMYEFMVPEPAAFHNVAMENKKDSVDVEVVVKPVDPRTGDGMVRLKSPNDVTADNYLYWASIYNVWVNPKPDDLIVLGKSFSIEKAEPTHESVSKNDSIDIPEGYFTTEGCAVISGNDDSDYGQTHNISVLFGDVSVNVANSLHGVSNDSSYRAMKAFRGKVPVSLQYYNYHTGAVAITVKAALSSQALTKWQIETFNEIISAYETRLKDYNAKMSEIKATVAEKTRTNPRFYRGIENAALRKNCIEYMVSHDALGQSLLDGNSVQTLTVEYANQMLETYAAKVKFFEQAFEWDLMSYHFYPFYWANKDNWADLYNVSETDDALFRAFLQSGMARVILTVRPGFEEAVNWYMATGQVWNGGQVPTINDKLFIAIVKELQTPPGTVEETWESRVPTSLTVIQAGSIGLDVKGLPCDEDCKEWKQFDSDGEVIIDPVTGQPVSANPIIQSVDDHGNPVSLGNVVDEMATVSESIAEIQEDIEEIKTALNITD